MNSTLGHTGTTEATVRSITIDGEKCACVYDVIHMVTGAKDAAKRMQFKRIPEDLKSQCKRWQFPGERQKEVAVAPINTMVGIICALPGERAKRLRQECIKIVEKILNGDTSSASASMEHESMTSIVHISSKTLPTPETHVEVSKVRLPMEFYPPKRKNVRGTKSSPTSSSSTATSSSRPSSAKSREPWAICIAADHGFPTRTIEFRLIQDLFDAFPPPVLSKRKLYEAKNQNVLVNGWYIMDKSLYLEGYKHINRKTAVRSPLHVDWFPVDDETLPRGSLVPRERKKRSRDDRRRNDSSSSYDSDSIYHTPPPKRRLQSRVNFDYDEDLTGIKADLLSTWAMEAVCPLAPAKITHCGSGGDLAIKRKAGTNANSYKTVTAIEQRMNELRQKYRDLMARAKSNDTIDTTSTSSSSSSTTTSPRVHMLQDTVEIPSQPTTRTRSREVRVQ